MNDTGFADRVASVRRFSRFYTRRIGALHEGLLGGPLSLAEGRIVYELAQADGCTAAWLRGELGLDAGYLSRLLAGLEARGLVERRPSAADARQSVFSLAEAGRHAFAVVDGRSRAQIGAMLERLAPAQQQRLVDALTVAETLLGDAPPAASASPWAMRPPRPGDFGWVVHRHGALYHQEYGWDERFEALVAEIVAQFVRTFDARRERCWIAERDGAVVGSVFLVRQDDAVAKLRLLYVEPRARGSGIGRRLVDECIGFARHAGYRRVVLWTNDVLVAARSIYERAGFRLVEQERHHSFGHDLVGENWALDLES